MNVRKAFKPGRPRGNVAQAHLDWRTRTKGTFRQLGKKFPITAEKGHLGPHRWAKRTLYDRPKMTRLEMETLKAERDMESSGVKGFMIGIKLHDGTTTEIPLMANNWHQAFFIAHKSMMKYDPEDIDEITIVDPSLSEIAHAIGGAAHKAAGWIKKGATETIPALAKRGIGFAKRTYKAAEAAAIKAAKETGRVAALPAELQEAYEVGKEQRPGIIPAAAGEPERRVLTPDEASRLIAEAMRGAPITEAARAEVAKAPLLYRPAQEPAPYTAEELRGAQRRIAERRAAARRPLTPSEVERRRQSASRPFQSKVFGGSQYPSSVPSGEEPSTALEKTRRQLRKARKKLRQLGGYFE